jgi:D-aspartate ligase
MTRATVPAIVLAHGLNGLGAVRSLGIAGVPVWAVVDSLRESCAKSRYCHTFLRMPDESAADVISRLARSRNLDSAVVLATSDEDALQLAAAQHGLPPSFFAASATSDTVASLVDKRLEIQLLSGCGVPLPASLVAPTLDLSMLIEALSFPIIFKPRTQQIANSLEFKNWVVSDQQALSQFITAHGQSLDRFIAQEVVPGGDENTWVCNATFNSSSDMVAGFTFQRLGMSPPHFGVTTLAVSRRNDRLLEESSRIARALRYRGPAMLEFKLDDRDGKFKYIEINPRLGMCNWFDTRCGVNNAYRSYRLALGDESTHLSRQADNVHFVDLYSDLYSRIASDGESVSSVLTRYARLFGKKRVAAYWLTQDPRPALAALRRRSRRFGIGLRRRVFETKAKKPPPETFVPSVKRLVTKSLTARPVRTLVNATLGPRASIFLLHRLRDAERRGSGHDIAFLDHALNELKGLGCNFVSLADLTEVAQGSATLSRPAVALSIDDGYADQAELAGHLLARGLPVTLFAITDLVDGRDWPWDAKIAYCLQTTRNQTLRLDFDGWKLSMTLESALKRLQATRLLRARGKAIPGNQVPTYVQAVADAAHVEIPIAPPANYRGANWSDLRDLKARGLQVAPHSLSHRSMSSLTDAEAREELEGSWNRVRSELPGSPPILAWPTGRHEDYTERDLRLAQSLGFRAAFAVNNDYGVLAGSELSRFAINRFSMPETVENVIQCATGIERMKQIVFHRGEKPNRNS